MHGRHMFLISLYSIDGIRVTRGDIARIYRRLQCSSSACLTQHFPYVTFIPATFIPVRFLMLQYRPWAKAIKKNTNSTQNKSQTHRAKQYEVTSFLSTDCELTTETCSKNVYSLGPWSSYCPKYSSVPSFSASCIPKSLLDYE